MAVLPKLIKGFLYGLVIGIFMALAIYLLVGAVITLGFITVPATTLAGIVFSACIVAGVGMEYADWINDTEEENKAPK